MPRLRTEDAIVAPFPLPPVPEQHRIVAKVDELMALCDTLEVEREKREATRDRLATASLSRLTASDLDEKQFKAHAEFAIKVLPELTTRPDQIKTLRQTILDLAVRGKLVEQDPSDESVFALLDQIAVEKSEAGPGRRAGRPSEQTIEERPTTIPESWQWSTLADISLRLHYGYTASAQPNVTDVRLLRITDIQDNRVNWDAVPGCIIEEAVLPNYALSVGDILIARTGGTIGKSYLVQSVPMKTVFASYLIRVQPARSLFDRYLKAFLESELYWGQLRAGARGAGQPNVNGQTLGRMNVPIPPRLEQHRIVAKLDELMGVCEQLEQHLTLGQTFRGRLYKVLKEQALELTAMKAA